MSYFPGSGGRSVPGGTVPRLEGETHTTGSNPGSCRGPTCRQFNQRLKSHLSQLKSSLPKRLRPAPPLPQSPLLHNLRVSLPWPLEQESSQQLSIFFSPDWGKQQSLKHSRHLEHHHRTAVTRRLVASSPNCRSHITMLGALRWHWRSRDFPYSCTYLEHV